MFMLDMGKLVLSNADKVNIPVLIMVGSAEGIVSKKAIHTFCEKSEKCTEKIWDGFFHELHNEPKKQMVFEFTLDWLLKHI